MRRFSQLSPRSQQLFLSISFALISYTLLVLLGIPFLLKNQASVNGSNLAILAGQKAKEAYQETTSTSAEAGVVLGERTPSLYIQGGEHSFSSGGLIAMSTLADPYIKITGYNTNGNFKVTLYQTDESAILKYLEYDDEYKQKNKTVDTAGMTEVTTFEKTLSSSGNSSSNDRIDLPIQGAGMYFLKLENPNMVVNSFIVRSDFGAVAKNADDQALIWAQDFTNMRRLPGVSLTTYSLKDGQQQLSTGQTNDEGIATLNVNTPPDLAILKKDNRTAILPLNLQYLSSWGGGLYHQFKNSDRVTKFFTFTDRPLYQPGDKLYFKSILRDEDDVRFTIPSGTATVTLGRGYREDETVLFTKQIPISSDGTIDGEIPLPEDVATGNYSLKVSVSKELVSYKDVEIEFFRKPEYSVEIDASQRQIVAGDELSFTINGSFFSGQPLANKEVSYEVHSGDYYYYEYYNSHSDDDFSNEYRYGGYWGGDPITTGTATLDEKGQAVVKFKSKIPKPGSSQIYSIEVNYEDETGNPSFDRRNVLVLDGEYSLYRSPETRYSSRVNEPAQLDLKLKSNISSSVTNIPLSATVTRSNWVKYQDPNQKYPSYREEKETLAPLSATSNSQGLAHFEFTPQKEGSYNLLVQGKDGRGNIIERNFYLYITDREGTLYGRDNNESTLSLSVDKNEYRSSDNVNATITSHYPFRDVLLTFERRRVNRYQVVQLNQSATTIPLELVETDIPNIFVNVTSFAGNDFDSAVENIKLNTDSKKMKVQLTPDRTTYGPADEVKLNVQTTDQAGNPVSADVAVWAVDKAIFELSASNLGNIFDTFWEERYLQTSTTHSLEGITVNSSEQGGGCFVAGTMVTFADGTQKPIEEVKIGDQLLTRASDQTDQLISVEVKNTHNLKQTGYFIINESLKVTPNHYLWINSVWQTADQIQVGDQMWSSEFGSVEVSSLEWVTQVAQVYNLETSGNHTYLANDYWVHNQKGGGDRTVFKDVPYWNPHVRTDGNGRAQVVFKLPDNLTTWVISAVGATESTVVGQNTHEIKVNKSIVMRPVLPNLLQVDDPIILESIVQNFTDTPQNFQASLLFDSGDVWPTEVQPITVPAKDSAIVKWNVIPRNANPNSKLTFSAKTAQVDLSDTITQQIEVKPFGFVQESALTGNNSSTFPISLPTKIDPDQSSVTLNLDSSIITTLPTAIEYLINYPYGCVEQTTSRFVPTVIAASNPTLFKETLEGKDVPKIIAKGINRLKDHQSAGGWSWWGNQKQDLFISAYVIEYVLKAKEAGYQVDSEIIEQARHFFERDASLSNEEQVARAYALALLNSDKKTAITSFENLSPDILALAVMTNIKLGNNDPQTNGLAKLMAMAQTEGKEVFWASGTNSRFGSREASTALASRAIMMGNGDRQMLVGAMQYLLNHRKSYYWGNTFATAQVIQAVSDYSLISNELNPAYTYQVSIDGKQIGTGSVQNVKTPIKPITIPLNLIKADGTSVIEVTKTGEGELYTTLVNKFYVTDKSTPAIEHGATISRRYISDDGDEVIPAVGDYVTVELTIKGLKEQGIYGVIHDYLPVGMIPVNRRFSNQQAQTPTGSYWRYSEGMSSVEYTQDGAILSMSKISAGVHRASYKARVISQGEFTAPPAKFALMYNPEVYAQTGISMLKIGTESIVIPSTGDESDDTIDDNEDKLKKINNDWRFLIGAYAVFAFVATFAFIQIHKFKNKNKLVNMNKEILDHGHKHSEIQIPENKPVHQQREKVFEEKTDEPTNESTKSDD